MQSPRTESKPDFCTMKLLQKIISVAISQISQFKCMTSEATVPSSDRCLKLHKTVKKSNFAK